MDYKQDVDTLSVHSWHISSVPLSLSTSSKVYIEVLQGRDLVVSPKSLSQLFATLLKPDTDGAFIAILRASRTFGEQEWGQDNMMAVIIVELTLADDVRRSPSPIYVLRASSIIYRR